MLPRISVRARIAAYVQRLTEAAESAAARQVNSTCARAMSHAKVPICTLWLSTQQIPQRSLIAPTAMRGPAPPTLIEKPLRRQYSLITEKYRGASLRRNASKNYI